MPWWLQWRARRKRRSNRRLTVSLGRFAVPGRASRRTRLMCSNTPWCKTRPTARCSASLDARLHARIAERWKTNCPRLPRTSLSLLARHCTDAGLIEKAAALWGKAGRRSMARSALVEAVAQLHPGARPNGDLAWHARAAPRGDRAAGRAHNPAIDVKGYAAPEIKAADGEGPADDRTSRSARRATEDPLCCFRSSSASGSRTCGV